MQPNQNTLVLFTKEYPYGKRESYIEGQLKIWSDEFDEILIVPYWIFRPGEHRPVPENCQVFVPELNNLDLKSKLMREWMSFRIFFYQLAYGRDFKKHLLNFRTLLTQLRTLWCVAYELTQHPSYTHARFFHDYWMHNGVIIAGILQKLQKSKLKITCQAHALDLYHSDLKKVHNTSDSFLPFEALKLSFLDAIFCISKHGQEFLRAKYPSKAHLFMLQRLGVNDPGDNFCHNHIQRTHILVSCSLLTENKRVHDIPSILSQLNVPFHWYHFGDGDEVQTARLEREVDHYQLTHQFTLMGWRPNVEVLEFYRNNVVSFFLNLSFIEGIPVAMMEAASFGIPLLGTNTVGVPEIVNSTTGLLIPVEYNHEECAKQLNAILSDPITHKKLRLGARKMFVNHYESRRNFTQLAEWIKSSPTR